jgi:hypothetical protein
MYAYLQTPLNFHLSSASFPETDRWLLVMSTQVIGFSIGGFCKRVLVASPSMIWPENLQVVTVALFNTLHAQEIMGTHGRDDISRKRFFIYVFIDYFLYSQLSLRPGDLPFLSYDPFRVRFLPILSLYRRLQLFMGLLDHPR